MVIVLVESPSELENQIVIVQKKRKKGLVHVVFGSRVQSGLLTLPGMDRDRDRSSKLGNCKKPDWTGVDRSFAVFCGLKTGLGPVFGTVLNRH